MPFDELPDGKPDSVNQHELIARRAYTLWERRGRPENQDVGIWLEAESALRYEDEFRELLKHIKLEETRESESPSIDNDSEAFAPDSGPEIAAGHGRLPSRGTIPDG